MDEFYGPSLSIPWFLKLIYDGREDLKSLFDLTSYDGEGGLNKWWIKHGCREYPFWNVPIFKDSALNKSLLRNSVISEIGVNLIGFSRGVLGLGEDVRLARMACEAGSIPYKMMDAPISGPLKLDDSIIDNMGSELPHAISLFCLPPTDMVRIVSEGGGQCLENIAYGIGLWPWELSHWPKSIAVDSIVDEIWAQSKFVESAFRLMTDKPVTLMPHTVEVLTPNNWSKKIFGFDEQTFLFLVMFDGNSWISRKNPIGSISAYLKAFPNPISTVGLLIKVINIFVLLH
jgi:hypothetical protein